MRVSILIACLVFFLAGSTAAGTKRPDWMKLYTFDCGRITVADKDIYSDGGEYEGQSVDLVVPCFLIRHPRGDLMWETGIPDTLVGRPGGFTSGIFTYYGERTVESQLAQIGVTPEEIEYVALSHWHSDHSGNANLFAGSTWIVNPNERAYMFRDEAREGRGFRYYDELESARTMRITGNLDLFRDGTVVVMQTPGHTPGHLSLRLILPKAGTIYLSGDLYHFEENRTHRRVPRFNHDREATLLSMDTIEGNLAIRKGRLIIQHDARSSGSLPRAPEFLE